MFLFFFFFGFKFGACLDFLVSNVGKSCLDWNSLGRGFVLHQHYKSVLISERLWKEFVKCDRYF